MLIARKEAEGPAWKAVMGAEILFAPIDRAMLRRARRAALKALGREGEVAAGGDADDRALEQLEELGDALSFALIMEGAKDWRDVASQLLDDAGAPVLDANDQPQFEVMAFSAENLAATLSDPLVFEAFDAVYVMPFAARERARIAQGKDLLLSPNGTSSMQTPGQITAGSPAATARAADAPSARTARKPRKPTKKTGSGR